ncbi:ABC transporter permease [Xylanibacillus composti]|uniref:ABC transporter permease n=1 Tax=Xylanibacillus composti TaxID=1572762 RepID=UPI001BCD9EA7|nr:ABC transporter permease [Xylanibacillus composti]MDT9723591.1 ABC transporter permease [Xylanibacillus composti]
MIYASAMLSRLVVDEYRNRTIAVLFMYPINRKKLLLSKLLIVCGLTFMFIIVSTVLVSAGFHFVNERGVLAPGPLTADIIAKQSLQLVVNAVSSAGLALIPLLFGFRKKSVPTTIISSILIVTLLYAGNNGESLGTIIAIPIALGLIGVSISYMPIRRVEHDDL